MVPSGGGRPLTIPALVVGSHCVTKDDVLAHKALDKRRPKGGFRDTPRQLPQEGFLGFSRLSGRHRGEVCTQTLSTWIADIWEEMLHTPPYSPYDSIGHDLKEAVMATTSKRHVNVQDVGQLLGRGWPGYNAQV